LRAENRLASAFEEFILPYDALRTAAPDAALLELHKGETSFDREAIEAEIMTGGSGVCAFISKLRARRRTPRADGQIRGLFPSPLITCDRQAQMGCRSRMNSAVT
jgi:hypothetical protein